MNHETLGAEFGAMTDETQGSTVGGDAAFAKSTGEFLAFWGDTILHVALMIDRGAKGAPVYYYGKALG